MVLICSCCSTPAALFAFLDAATLFSSLSSSYGVVVIQEVNPSVSGGLASLTV
jgi:hypothetical protein